MPIKVHAVFIKLNNFFAERLGYSKCWLIILKSFIKDVQKILINYLHTVFFKHKKINWKYYKGNSLFFKRKNTSFLLLNWPGSRTNSFVFSNNFFKIFLKNAPKAFVFGRVKKIISRQSVRSNAMWETKRFPVIKIIGA